MRKTTSKESHRAWPGARAVRIVSAALALVAVATLGSTQDDSRSAPEKLRTAISVTGGLSSGSSDTGGALGASVVRDLSDRASLEVTGTYLDRGAGAEAVSAGLQFLVNLRRGDREVVPYLSAGGGLYWASFHMGYGRFMGAVPQGFGSGMTLHMQQGQDFGYWMGPSGMMGPWTSYAPGSAYGPGMMPWGQMPDFYGRRLGNMAVPSSGYWGMRGFTDPALSLGGGVRVDLTKRLFLRPEARVVTVFGGGDSYSLGLFTVNLAYRF